MYGDKDADGFYRGECGGRIGYIPCNMVSEIQVNDPELEEQLLLEVQDNGTMANSALSEQLSGKQHQNNVILPPTNHSFGGILKSTLLSVHISCELKSS